MKIYEILIEILEKPNVSKFYRNLRDQYKKEEMPLESSAIDWLIQKKFRKKDDITSDDSHHDQEQ
jgi:hypothetical protein